MQSGPYPKNAFVSWSGSDAQRIAIKLKEFIKSVLPGPSIFVSTEDIPGGKPWFAEIARAIEDCNAGVIIITPASLTRPWLHFEAGAIAKHIELAFVIPLLCGVAPGDLHATPLAQFQALTLNRGDLLKLCGILCRALDYSDDDLTRRFDVWWKELGDSLLDVAQGLTGEKAEAQQPSVADISTQIEHLAATIETVATDVRRLGTSTSPAIMGQGPLATASPSEAARLMQPYLLQRPAVAQDLSERGVVVETRKRRTLHRPKSPLGGQPEKSIKP